MPVQIDTVEFWVLAGAVTGFLGMLFHVVLTKYHAAKAERDIVLVSKVLHEYFRKTGVEVSVHCVRLPDSDGFTALVESEPMKQFRLSHIIEIALRDHVQNTCGMELDKIFWRFPIKVAARSASAVGAAAGVNKNIEGADDYINEGLVHYKDLPKFEATEIPWEKFEEASTQESKKT
ncbi:MAG: hypothetical protein ACHP7O_02955 [Burkholderiales bacterium]